MGRPITFKGKNLEYTVSRDGLNLFIMKHLGQGMWYES